MLRLANDILQSNLLGANSKVIIILDGDVQQEVEPFLLQNNITLNTPLNYLPVPSLEKYLKNKLYDQVDQKLTQELDNYIFQKVGLRRIMLDYKNIKTMVHIRKMMQTAKNYLMIWLLNCHRTERVENI